MYYLATTVSLAQPFLHGANTPQYVNDQKERRRFGMEQEEAMV
jgi:hypothetical protein